MINTTHFLLSNHFKCLYEDEDDLYLEFNGDINLKRIDI